jgi:HEAT repeat protein
MNFTRALILVCILAGAALAQAVPSAATGKAREFFVSSLNDDVRLPIVLAGLRSVDDPAVLPIFTRLMESDDREIRLMATAMVRGACGGTAIPALQKRLAEDPSMAIRAKALVELEQLDGVSADALLAATRLDDQELRILAARGLVRLGQADQARPILQELTASRDTDTACFARMSLLGLGDKDQIEPLRQIILDPTTDPDLLILLLNQIRQEKITAAMPVAEYLAGTDQPRAVRIRAYMVIDELGTPLEATTVLTEAIEKSDNTMLRLNLLRLLTAQSASKVSVKRIAQEDSITGAVARFEMARSIGGSVATTETRTCLDLGHPVIVEYVLGRFAENLQADKHHAAFYVQPLLDYLGREELESPTLTRRHERAAMAVELLANLGTKPAMDGLTRLLNDSASQARQKLIAGALYRSTNATTAELVRPMLKSGYPELRTLAALLLAKHNQPDAIPVLLDIQNTSRTHKADVLTLTNWYLLKLAGQAGPATIEIARQVK